MNSNTNTSSDGNEAIVFIGASIAVCPGLLCWFGLLSWSSLWTAGLFMGALGGFIAGHHHRGAGAIAGIVSGLAGALMFQIIISMTDTCPRILLVLLPMLACIPGVAVYVKLAGIKETER